jgi:hypothetical protein
MPIIVDGQKYETIESLKCNRNKDYRRKICTDELVKVSCVVVVFVFFRIKFLLFSSAQSEIFN